MGGRAGCPLGASPVMKNWTAFSWFQPGSPAMLGEVSAQTGMGTIDANSSFLPCSHLPGTNSPFSFIGVWQSPHWPMAFTKYSPCAICCCLGPLLPEAAALWSTTVMARSATAIARIIGVFIHSPWLVCAKFWSGCHRYDILVWRRTSGWCRQLRFLLARRHNLSSFTACCIWMGHRRDTSGTPSVRPLWFTPPMAMLLRQPQKNLGRNGLEGQIGRAHV